MLTRIGAITFVALFSLALAGTSIADTKKPPPQSQGGQNDPATMFQEVLKQLMLRQQGTGPKGSGTTSRGTVGAKNK